MDESLATRHIIIDQATNVVLNHTALYDEALLPAIPGKPFCPIEPSMSTLFPPAIPSAPELLAEDASDEDKAAYVAQKADYDRQMVIIQPVAEAYNAAIADYRLRHQQYCAALILYNVAMENYGVAMQQAMMYRYTPPAGTIIVKSDKGQMGDIYNPADGSFTTPPPKPAEPIGNGT